MRSFVALSVAVLAACASVASAVVTVELTRFKRVAGTFAGREFALSRARAALLGSHSDGGQTTIPTTNIAVAYTTSVGIGNPPTYYTLLVDSGSSNTWCGAIRPYNRTSTSIPTGQNVSVGYGSGNFSGVEYLDQVTLAPNLVIANQSIGDALTSTVFAELGVDGIIGFGPLDLTDRTLSPDTNATIPTVMSNLVAQGLIGDQVLGVYFAPTTSDNETNGYLTYGGVEPTLYVGELTYTPLTTTNPASHYWGINVTSSTYNNVDLFPTSTAGIVDTGTTQILLASEVFNAYVNAIPGATFNTTLGLLQIPPSSISFMRALDFVIGGTTFSLDVAAQLVPLSQSVVWGGVAGVQYGTVGDLGAPSGSGLDFILGMSFMERFYAVFDADARRVGFAKTENTYTDCP